MVLTRLFMRAIARLSSWLGKSGKNKPTKGGIMPSTTVTTFSLVKFGSKMKAKQEKVRAAFNALEAAVNELKDSREKSLAKTSVEEAYTWASRAIRAEQLARNARNR